MVIEFKNNNRQDVHQSPPCGSPKFKPAFTKCLKSGLFLILPEQEGKGKSAAGARKARKAGNDVRRERRIKFGSEEVGARHAVPLK
jgi:hypothetical protein